MQLLTVIMMCGLMVAAAVTGIYRYYKIARITALKRATRVGGEKNSRGEGWHESRLDNLQNVGWQAFLARSQALATLLFVPWKRELVALEERLKAVQLRKVHAGIIALTRATRVGDAYNKSKLDDLESAANDKRPALIASGFTVLGGGEPIFVDGYCVGAVGVSGVLPTEDAEVAKAGAAAVCPTTAPPDVPAKAVAFEA